MDYSIEADADATLIRLSGSLNESFRGVPIPNLMAGGPTPRAMILDVGGIGVITSFGVRQWLNSMEQLAKVRDLYFINCPSFFVDQVNMVLNFCGPGKVITAFAPYACQDCNAQHSILVDVLARHGELTEGKLEQQVCPSCKGALVFDESPSYFHFIKRHAATTLSREAARVLRRTGAYVETNAAPPASQSARGLKLVQDGVTYLKLIGVLDDQFRSRAFRVGVEGEFVLDLEGVTELSRHGAKEFSRLLTALSESVSIMLIEVPPVVQAAILDGQLTLGKARLHTVLVDYRCVGCGARRLEGFVLSQIALPDHVCSTCGDVDVAEVSETALAALRPHASGTVDRAALGVVASRRELVSRAQARQNIVASGYDGSDRILGKYRIVGTISSGGMADIFLAVAEGIGGFEKPVALKRIRHSMLERAQLAVAFFLDEAKISAQLAHPNIVQVFEVGEERGQLYIAMEYVRGLDLQRLLRLLKQRNTPLPLADALFITLQIAQALAHAHHATDLNGKPLRIVHRDVSPSNILIDHSGNVKLVDFGIAASAVTRSGVEQGLIAGKVRYMSPEQSQGHPVDQTSDIFSLGVVLFELCTGELPFDRGGSTSTDAATMVDKPCHEPVSQSRPALPGKLDGLVGQMLAPSPQERFQDAEAVVRALREFAMSCQIDLLSGISLDIPMFAELAQKDTGRVRVYSDTPPAREAEPASTPALPSEVLSLPRSADLALDVEAPIIRANLPDGRP